MPAVDDLWPEDIFVEVVLTPEQILQEQCTYLDLASNGRLKAEVKRTEIDDRVVLSFEAQSVASKRTARLFEAQHRVGFEYPVFISVLVEDLPEYLRARILKRGNSMLSFTQEDQWVDNPWVTTSPAQFMKKVKDVLARPAVKAAILSLLAAQPAVESADSREPEDLNP